MGVLICDNGDPVASPINDLCLFNGDAENWADAMASIIPGGYTPDASNSTSTNGIVEIDHTLSGVAWCAALFTENTSCADPVATGTGFANYSGIRFLYITF